MLSDLMNQSVTVVSRSYSDVADQYGNQVPTETTTDMLVFLQQIAAAEKGGYVPETTDLIVLPTGTVIDADDVIIDGNGLRYEVIGPPTRVWNPRTHVEHHVEATLKRSAGGTETP